MKNFTFTVVGTPKPQPRPRAFARKVGNKYTARVYDAATAEHWKSQIAESARDAGLDGLRMEGAVLLTVRCYFTRPKNHYRSGKNSHELRFAVIKDMIQRPDLDNIMKAVKDCLTQIGAWADDAQVIQETISKCWTIEGSFTDFHIQGYLTKEEQPAKDKTCQGNSI